MAPPLWATMDDADDAYGHAIRDYHERGEGFELIERDDGFVGLTGGPELYFTEHDEWPEPVREGLTYVEGSVLDVGCGAGRHALYCQRRGHDVLGIDVSPNAVAVAADRGLERVRELDVADVDTLEETFDTVLMLGNNFGLVGTRETAPERLRALARASTDDARLVAGTRDVTATDDEAHLAYHERNRERGRLPGAIRMRARYRGYATDWFDYLMVSPAELRDLLAETPWTVAELIGADDGGGQYVAVLEKPGR